jgi:5-(carboxyamino)imidazole ribonucleotide mutase
MSADVLGKVAIVMGSDSDWEVMRPAAEVLAQFGVATEARVLSAHRTPDETIAYARTARAQGFRVIIAGAGGAAALPGMIAAVTELPVIGVPVALQVLDGLDSLLSIAQMPGGVPVARVGLGGAKNAGLLAARILAQADTPAAAQLRAALTAFAQTQRDQVLAKDETLRRRAARPTDAP